MSYSFNPFSGTLDDVNNGFDETANYSPTGNWTFSTGEVCFEDGICIGETTTTSIDNRITQRFNTTSAGAPYLTRTYQESEDTTGGAASSRYVFEVAHFPDAGSAGTSHFTAKGDGTIQFGGRALSAPDKLFLIGGSGGLLDNMSVGFTSIGQFGSSSTLSTAAYHGNMLSGAWFSARMTTSNTGWKTVTGAVFDLGFDASSYGIPTDGRYIASCLALSSGYTRISSYDEDVWIDQYGYWASGNRGTTLSRFNAQMNTKNFVFFESGTHTHWAVPEVAMMLKKAGEPPTGYLWNAFSFRTGKVDFDASGDSLRSQTAMLYGGMLFRTDEDVDHYRDIYFRDRYQTISSEKKRELNIRAKKGPVTIQDHDTMAWWASNALSV